MNSKILDIRIINYPLRNNIKYLDYITYNLSKIKRIDECNVSLFLDFGPNSFIPYKQIKNFQDNGWIIRCVTMKGFGEIIKESLKPYYFSDFIVLLEDDVLIDSDFINKILSWESLKQNDFGAGLFIDYKNYNIHKDSLKNEFLTDSFCNHFCLGKIIKTSHLENCFVNNNDKSKWKDPFWFNKILYEIQFKEHKNWKHNMELFQFLDFDNKRLYQHPLQLIVRTEEKTKFRKRYYKNTDENLPLEEINKIFDVKQFFLV
jgi:hypothetical protein